MNILKKIFRKGGETAKAGFFGNYSTWQQARICATGYDSSVILEKTRAAMLEIVSGRATFERDSVLMQQAEYPWPLISCLLYVAASSHGRLSVLDFSGALGSSFYQCRSFLQNIPDLAWAVVEQKHYVEVGRAEFSNESLSFHNQSREAASAVYPNLLLLSSVLPYLPNPWSLLEEVLSLGIQYTVLDRTPFLLSDRDRLTVQFVPREIYPASYPAWFFGKTRLIGKISEFGYKIRAQWQNADRCDPDGEKAEFSGIFFEKKP